MNDLASVARQAFSGRARILVTGLALTGLGLVAYWHSTHLIPVLPYLLLLACPLAHLFMPHGHGSASHHSDDKDASLRPRSPDDTPRGASLAHAEGGQ